MNWFKNSVVISLASLTFNAQAQLGETPIIVVFLIQAKF